MPQNGTGHQGGASVDAPAVLLLDEVVRGQQYLEPTNSVLEALYGHAPVRFTLMHDDIPWWMFYPHSGKVEIQLELLKLFSDVSWNQMEAFVESDEYLRVLMNYVRAETRQGNAEDASPAPDGWEKTVKVVIANEYLVSNSQPMIRLMSAYFTGAKLFTVNQIDGRGIPKPVHLPQN